MTILGADGQKMETTKPQVAGLAVGRVVHFCNGPREDKRGPDVVAAIVTKVYPDSPGICDLTVFLLGMFAFVQEVPHQEGESYKDQHWSWPPRV